VPSTIGFSSVNSRPISASVRLLRNGLLWLRLLALRAKCRHAGTAATANTANSRSCACQDRLMANDSSPTRSAASPSQNMKTPGASSSSAIRMKPKISQFQVPNVVNISAMTRTSREDLSRQAYFCGVTGGGVGPVFGTDDVRRAAADAEATLSPNVALAISPMPASEDSTLVASIGIIRSFWFGESANCPNALMYLSAIK